MALILCHVTDRKLLRGAPESSAALLERIRAAIAAGVGWIQLREKDLSGRALAGLAREAIAAARGTATQIIINDRLDVAIAAGAAGVHLGGASLPVAEVAAWCAKNAPARGAGGDEEQAVGLTTGATFLVGASCHSLAEAQAAERAGAQYVIFGPVYSTPSKSQYGAPQGLARLEEVCRAVRVPVLAIGGITLENAGECLRAGAGGIAAIRLFQESGDLRRVLSALGRAS